MKLYNYIKTVLTFFYSKFVLANNEAKANAISTMITQWEKFMNSILLYDNASVSFDKIIKKEFHGFILNLKKNKSLFESTDKRLFVRLISLLQKVRIKDIKTLLLCDLSEVQTLDKIFTEKRNITIHFPKGKKKIKKEIKGIQTQPSTKVE